MQVKEKANFLQTPSQTAGPYVHIGLLPDAAGHTNLLPRLDAEVLWSDVREGRIEITGRISDGAGDLVKDATIEFWQADVSGHYVAAAANDMLHGRGWGRCSTDFQSGLFKISTLKPGAVVDASGRLHAPHLTLWIIARGLNDGLYTRIYFEDENDKNVTDYLLTQKIPTDRKKTLIAKTDHSSETLHRYIFDIVLQGDNETVFFDL